ncbi:MAG: SEC-C domain-containing protein [Phycisphaerae bacterium]|nr:SEC-C domain-containing protein [Phycisphaerae bacterium]
MVRTSLGEYIDEEEAPEAWDVGGLLKWAQRLFPVALTQNHMRKMSPTEIEDALYEAADAHYDKIDLSPIEVYLDPQYGRGALADWVRSKFGIDFKREEILSGTVAEVTELITRKARETYKLREVRYPIEAIINRAFGTTGTDSVYSLQIITDWANSKYRVGWTPERLAGKSIDAIARDLESVSLAFLEGGLTKEIDDADSRYRHNAEGLTQWAQERFSRALDPKKLTEPDAEAKKVLQQAGYELVRWELTHLERYVLLRIYDQGWKDHLLEMDHLKYAIMQRPMGGDQTHPQSQYAIEGRELFEQMWRTIRDRVTDIIFKVGGGPGGGEATETSGTTGGPGGLLSRAQLRYDSATGTGFTSADQEAAMRAQGEAKPATIRRDEPRVGRNDPCPCGSGKKYKQCHGRK